MSVSRAHLSGAVALLLLASTRGSTQATGGPDAGPVPIGSHLRVRGPNRHSAVFSGRLRQISNDSITIALDDDEAQLVPFAITDIGRAEIERDAHSRDQATATMGVVGGVGGLTAAVLWCRNNRSDCAEEIRLTEEAAQNDDTYVGTSLLMIMGGVAVGSLIGYALAPPPHWDLVTFPTRTSDKNGSSRLLLNVGLRYSLAPRRRR